LAPINHEDLTGRETDCLQHPVVSPAGQSREYLESTGSECQKNEEQSCKECASSSDSALFPLGADEIVTLRDQNAVCASAWLVCFAGRFQTLRF